MTQASCECVILAVLKKNTVKDVSLVKDLVPLSEEPWLLAGLTS